MREDLVGRLKPSTSGSLSADRAANGVLHPLEIVSVSLEQLARPVASLAKEGDRIIQALDDLLTRAWG
jgi:hypothetical protein